MTLLTEPYIAQIARLPTTGRHVVAQLTMNRSSYTWLTDPP
jgi:hypothetical protein